MKYSAILCLVIIFACACHHRSRQTELLQEQKLLKDRVNNMNDIIGGYIQKGAYDSAEAHKKQLGAIFARLTDIQSSLDSIANLKQ
jgi:hypothetical protein